MKERERRLEEFYEKLRQDIRQAANAEIERCEKQRNEAVAEKNKETARLAEQFAEELKKLTSKVDQLSRKLQG